jgi:cell wall-associated protease
MKPILFLFLFLLSCKSTIEVVSPVEKLKFKNEFNQFVLKNWYQKDFLQDSIPGISIDKWYSLNKCKLKNKSIVVAIIDTQIDSKHEDLQGQLWTNNKEIPNNNIDDDKNGYIDDKNGWSFIGTKSGGYLVWGNFEYVRIIRGWEPLFKDKKESEIIISNLSNYRQYLRASIKFEKENILYKKWLKSMKHSVSVYPLIKDTLKHFFPKEDYTYNQLDSLYKKYKINDKTYKQRRDDNDKDLGALISFMMVNLDSNEKTYNDTKDKEAQIDSIVNKNLNSLYDDRAFIGDNPNTLEKGYGNNNISNNRLGYRTIQAHSTKVSGIIAANRENNIGVKGFSQNIKIMPLNISCSGDEHDKDITMAIRYAVDNGAKVINMSFGKEFSLKQEWVSDALKYAEEHNVLVVHCAGNDGFNVDENPYYPSDVVYDGTGEVRDNFINVGSISQKLDSTFVSSFSNYGKKNVDLFAPGENIYTTVPDNKYDFDSGTSLAAPMVSGTAALIWLYYPNLSVQEVKKIILDSGTAYDLEVIVPGTKDKRVKFSELSKSGKVVNVYNAMQMAEKVSKSKK